MAVAIIKFNYSYLFFSAYYILLLAFSYLQNNYSAFNFSFINGEVKAYLFFALAAVSLMISHLFWGSERYRIWTKITIIVPIILGVISLIASQYVSDPSHLSNFFLLYTPSLLIFLIIPLAYLLQGSSKAEVSAPLMVGWFFLLFGICVSTFALSGFISPSAASINAYWYALFPQALCFIAAARISVDMKSQNFLFSKTLEIDENDTVTKIKASKEKTEQKRLLKVIEQERKVLTELRKSETRQKDDMRKAKEIADEANKGKSAFLAVVSHEIRTPMTGIMGMVRMLLDSNLTKEQNEYAQTIQDSSDAMLALLNDILDFEKIEQGKMSFENISFDLRRLIQGVSTLMQGHAKQKNIELNVKIGDDLPNFVIGDPTRLRQVLLNLTGNAIKFTEKGGVTITVETMKENTQEKSSEIYFNVIDNGIGISEDAKKNLFTPFSQADSSISRKFGGTGLGLAISKGLVEAMGSEINISSVENEGSTFFFTLTMKHGDKGSMPVLQPVISDTKNTEIEKKNILLIDDNNINRKVVHGLLSDLPYNIINSENAEEGIEKLKSQKFDLILMDIELPGINGDIAARQIRLSSRKDINNIPIIALTGHTNDEQIKHYYDCGMNNTLSKPIDPNALVNTIENVSKNIFENTPDIKKIKAVQTQSAAPIRQSESPLQQDKILTPNASTPTAPIAPKISSASAEQKIQPTIQPSIKPTTGMINIKKKPKAPAIMPLEKTSSTLPPIQKATPAPSVEKGEINAQAQDLDFKILNDLKTHLSTDSIQEMTTEALDKAEEIIADLENAAKTGNIEKIKTKSHDLKGMTGNFGLVKISDIAKELETKAKTQPPLVLATLVSKLPDAKKSAEEALSQWLSQNS